MSSEARVPMSCPTCGTKLRMSSSRGGDSVFCPNVDCGAPILLDGLPGSPAAKLKRTATQRGNLKNVLFSSFSRRRIVSGIAVIVSLVLGLLLTPYLRGLIVSYRYSSSLEDIIRLFPRDAKNVVWADTFQGKLVVVDLETASVDVGAMLDLPRTLVSHSPDDVGAVAFVRTIEPEGGKTEYLVSVVNAHDGSVVLLNCVYAVHEVTGLVVEQRVRVGSGEVLSSRPVGTSETECGSLFAFLTALHEEQKDASAQEAWIKLASTPDLIPPFLVGGIDSPHGRIGHGMGKLISNGRIAPRVAARVIQRVILPSNDHEMADFLASWSDEHHPSLIDGPMYAIHCDISKEPSYAIERMLEYLSKNDARFAIEDCDGGEPPRVEVVSDLLLIE